MKPLIPVIVLNWNNAGDSIACIRSILAQTWGHVEVLAGDNGSELSDYNQLVREFSDDIRIRFFRFEENLGFTKAHTILIAEALKYNSPAIALLNNDAEAEPGWLEAMMQCAKETNAGMITSKMLSYHHPEIMDNAGHFMLNTGEIIPLGHGEPASAYKERFYNIGPCAGACLYNSAMLKKTGLFDDYFETGYEDAELGLRAIAAGYTSVFEPDAIVRHKMGVSVNKVMNFDYLKKIQLNIFYTYLKIMPAGFIFLNLPFLAFKFFAIVIIDLIFLRLRFLKMVLISHSEFLTREKDKAFRARRRYRREIPHRRSTWFFLRKTRFFLDYDIYRFYKYILLANKTQYEK